eukprot:SAG31_NODE_417_length_15907_cov_6.901759_7_plen_56_part_00
MARRPSRSRGWLIHWTAALPAAGSSGTDPALPPAGRRGLLLDRVYLNLCVRTYMY